MPSPTPLLILASASPRRRELLDQLGVAYEVLPADVEERPAPGEAPEAYVRRVAADKSLAAQALNGGTRPVLAADTEVVLDGEILGKPRDFDHAADLLARLSGREHRVLSAVSLRLGGAHWEALSTSTVTFRDLTAEEIEAYWATGEPQGKAGAYAVQGLGAVFIRHLSGSYSGVMGLPLFETAELLRRIGIQIPAP
ncbi:Maf family protein [Methylomagnum sp.]